MSRKRRIEELDDPTTELETHYVDKDLTFRLVQQGNVEEFKALVNRVILLRARDDVGNSYLHAVLYECDTIENYKTVQSMLNYLISEASFLLSMKNILGETPLCTACRLDVIPEVIEILASTKNGLNVPDFEGLTPLMRIFSLNKFHTVYVYDDEQYESEIIPCEENEQQNKILDQMLQKAQILLNNGADVNYKGGYIDFNALGNLFFDNICYQISDDIFIKIIKFLLNNDSECFNVLSYVQTLDQAKTIIEHYKKSQLKTQSVSHLNNLVILDLLKPDIVEYMVDNGIKFICNEGTNLIELVRNKNLPLRVILKLLNIVPGYDINSKDGNGRTLIMTADDNFEIEELLEKGADPLIVDNFGNNILSYVHVFFLTKFDLNLIKKLINKGVNPLIFNDKDDNLLIKALDNLKYSYLICYEINTNLLVLIQVIFNLKYIKHSPWNLNLYNMYECIITKIFTLSYVYFDYLDSFEKCKVYLQTISKIIKMMVNTHNFDKFLLPSDFELGTIFPHYLFLDSNNLDPISFAMVHFIKNVQITGNEYRVEEFLTMLLNSGFPITNSNEIYVTPLVLLFYLLKNDSILETEIRLNLLQKFINSGMNTELNGLYLKEIKLPNSESCEVINYMREMLIVPDVLFVAFLFKKKDCVELLLDHYWAPPLTLMLCHPNLSEAEFDFWLPLLVKYGGIPHGTFIFQQYYKKFGHIVEENYEKLEHDKTFLAAWNICQEYKNTPLSLQQLCKYKIRELVAEKSSHPDTSLPSILHSLCPLSVPTCLLLQH